MINSSFWSLYALLGEKLLKGLDDKSTLVVGFDGIDYTVVVADDDEEWDEEVVGVDNTCYIDFLINTRVNKYFGISELASRSARVGNHDSHSLFQVTFAINAPPGSLFLSDTISKRIWLSLQYDIPPL